MNKKIIVSVLIIGGSGVAKAWTSKTPQAVTPVIMGSYIFLLMLSIVDLFGPDMAKLSGALALLAATYVLLEQDSFLWDILKKQTGTAKQSAPVGRPVK